MIELGTNPWILIILTFIEVGFIFIPPFIASKIEKNTLWMQLKELGLYKTKKFNLDQLKLAILGFLIGISLFLFGNFLYSINLTIIRHAFGEKFLQDAQSNAISTQPVEPSLPQFIIIILLQLIIVAVSEEIFFRAFLIKKFNRKFKPIFSIMIASLIFTIYHVPPFIVPIITLITYFGYYYTIGFLLSISYFYFDYSLIQNILAHGIFNILILLF